MENKLNNVRKLATIAKIEEIKSIPDAENIEHVRVRGWWVVARKGEFKEGDLCVYAEVDSVFPDGLTEEQALEWKARQKALSRAASEGEKIVIKYEMEVLSKLSTRPEFEFLRQSKFRIKTRRIFGEISQGIVFPLNIFPMSVIHFTAPEGPVFDVSNITELGDIRPLEPGIDVTDVLGITQYEPPDPAIMGGDAKGDMQNVGLLISDEERIENLKHKYDTMRQFIYYKNGVFGVTGRTIEFKIPEEDVPLKDLNVYWKMAKKFDMEQKIRAEISWHESEGLKNIAFQGELIGEGIQKNIYKLKGQEVRFYNAFDIDKQEYIEYSVFLKMLEDMILDSVPILDHDYELPENYIELLEEADTTYSVLNSDQLIEGFVYVAKEKLPKGTRITRSNFNRLSFKAKSRTYDMKKR